MLTGLALTLNDWAKRLDPNGKVDKIVEILSQTNEILDDMLFVEGNLPTGHMSTVRNGLPEVAWRMLNYGVKPSKSLTTQVTDPCGMLEAYSNIDCKLANLNGNSKEFLLSESAAFLEAMNQEQARTVLYGDPNIYPAKFIGLAPRYSKLTGADSCQNVIDAGGDGNGCTSIWVVVWGDTTAHGTFPKGSKAGLQQEFKGQQTVLDPDGGEFEAFKTHFSWDTGLVVRDWRYVVRIANIPVATLNTITLEDLLIQASELIPNLSAGRPSIYCNRTIRTRLRIEAKSKTNVHLGIDEFGGKRITHFDGIPVRRVDAILNTEQALV
jgi:hypothetical protein